MKNGNHLSGKMVSMQAGKLILETTFAGQLSIEWIEVERVVTEEPVTFVLKDGSTLKGK